MKRFWQTEISNSCTTREKWIFVIFVSGFTTLFLLIFQPFGVNNFDPSNSIDKVFLFAIIGFGLVTAASLSVFEFIISPLFFKKQTLIFIVFRIASELILVASVIFLFYNILGNFHDWYLKSYLGFIFNITVMGIIPVSIIFLYLSNKRTKRAYKELELKPMLSLSGKYVNLKSSNGKESISVNLNNLLFIEAQDNYISISYLENDKLKKQLLRVTMKEVESNLKTEFVLRCHRSFMVNLNKVEKVIKDGHHLKLFVPELTFPIIVSRSYISKIEAFLDVRHK